MATVDDCAVSSGQLAHLAIHARESRDPHRS